MFRFLSIELAGPNYIDIERLDPLPPRDAGTNVLFGQEVLPRYPDFSLSLRTVSETPPLAHWIWCGSYHIVADPMREVIERNTDEDIEWIPIKVFRPDRGGGRLTPWPESYGFSIMNVLGLLDCIDEEASVFSEKTTNERFSTYFYKELNKLRLNWEKISNRNIFLVMGHSFKPCLSLDLIRILTDAGSRGADWLNPEDHPYYGCRPDWDGA